VSSEQTSSWCPVERADVAALIGLCAVLDGHLMGGSSASGDLSQHLGRRLAQDGLAGADADQRGVRPAINDLDHRLRYALGEYPDAPTPSSVPA